LQILAETGLLGLVSLLGFLVSLIFCGIKQLLKKKDIVLLGLFAIFCGLCTNIFFDTQLYSLKMSILFWLLTALLATYIISKKRQKI